VYEAFRIAGGSAEDRLLPPAGADGHRMIESADAAEAWAPLVEKFLLQRRHRPLRILLLNQKRSVRRNSLLTLIRR
jgi:hypothetical protein